MKAILQSEISDADRFTIQALNLGLLMDSARHYLMGVDPRKTPPEQIIADTLEKLGFGRNGLESNFMTA